MTVFLTTNVTISLAGSGFSGIFSLWLPQDEYQWWKRAVGMEGSLRGWKLGRLIKMSLRNFHPCLALHTESSSEAHWLWHWESPSILPTLLEKHTGKKWWSGPAFNLPNTLVSSTKQKILDQWTRIDCPALDSESEVSFDHDIPLVSQRGQFCWTSNKVDTQRRRYSFHVWVSLRT